MSIVPLRSLARILLAALTLVAIGRQFMLHVAASYDTLNFFSYFTNLANLFAVGALLASALVRHSRGSAANDIARYISTVNMAIVGIVFALLLRDVDLGDLLPWVNVVVHYVMPVAVVLDWVLQPPGARLAPRHLVAAMAFPAAYLLYVLLRGAATGWYPYPFLNPANVGGYGGVAMYALGIFVVFLLAGSALRIAGNGLARRT